MSEVERKEPSDGSAADQQAEPQAEQEETRELTEDEKYAACVAIVSQVVSQRPIYYKLLRLVGTTPEDKALRKAVGALPEMKTAVKTPGFFVHELVDGYALAATPVYAEGEEPRQAAVGERVEPQAADPADAVAPQPAPEAGKASDAAPAGTTPAQPAEGAPQATDEASAAAGAEAPAQPAPKPVTYTYELTEVGRRVLAALSPSRHLERLYERDEGLDPAFDFVLDYCREPRRRGDLERELGARGFLASKNVSTSFYVDRLERAGGLVWEDGWRTTEEGRDFLDKAV
ncbi:hypothetical protein I3I95_00865 [bacterium]|nr:hypothetical protein [bacterium]